MTLPALNLPVQAYYLLLLLPVIAVGVAADVIRASVTDQAWTQLGTTVRTQAVNRFNDWRARRARRARRPQSHDHLGSLGAYARASIGPHRPHTIGQHG